MNLSPEKKIAGVLAPLFGLRSENDLGIGDVAVLREFIDWAAEIGFKLVQLLPINEMGADNSPYNAISAMAIEPTTLASGARLSGRFDPRGFRRRDRGCRSSEVAAKQSQIPRCSKTETTAARESVREFSQPTHPKIGNPSFRKFCDRESSWLNDYAFFRALVEANGGYEAWDQWPEEQRTITSARAWLANQSPERQHEHSEREDFFRYVQWIAREQWSAVKSYAEQRGVALMGDIPFGVSYYSADVFARPEQFALDWCGGAPPETHFKDDKFTQKWGQNWGIPLYRWSTMRQHNFDWWRQRVRAIAHCFHLFRIDHVLGFYRIYAFPWRPQQNRKFLDLDWNQMFAKTGGRAPHFEPRDDSTSESCYANCHEGEEYLRAILNEAGNGRVIGEDLGTVPDYVRPSLRSLGIAGFKIPQWEFYHGRRHARLRI